MEEDKHKQYKHVESYLSVNSDSYIFIKDILDYIKNNKGSYPKSFKDIHEILLRIFSNPISEIVIFGNESLPSGSSKLQQVFMIYGIKATKAKSIESLRKFTKEFDKLFKGFDQVKEGFKFNEYLGNLKLNIFENYPRSTMIFFMSIEINEKVLKDPEIPLLCKFIGVTIETTTMFCMKIYEKHRQECEDLIKKFNFKSAIMILNKIKDQWNDYFKKNIRG